MQNNELINDDCIKVMESLLNKGHREIYDAIITDPPYNISRANNFHTLKGRKGIDFGKWDYTFQQLNWLDSAQELLVPGGSIIIFNDWKNLGTIARYLNEKFQYQIKDVIRWVKKNPMPRNINRRYITDYEFAIWLVKPGATWTFNRQEEKYQRPEFKYSIVSGKEKIHPTQKKLKLMEEIIKIHTNKGDYILDPFAGGGTTCLAAYNLKRSFSGIEINKDTFQKAKKRLGNALNDNEFKVIKSPFNYLGGKFKHFPTISSYFPDASKVKTFYDAFLGSGEVLFNTNFNKSIAYEISPHLLKIFEYFKNNSFVQINKAIINVIKKHNLTQSYSKQYVKIKNIGLKPYNEKGFNDLRDDYNQKSSIVKLLVLIFYSFNNQIRFNKKGKYNVPVGKSDYSFNTKNKLKQYVNRIKRGSYQIIAKDFLSLPLSQFHKNDFVFLDPPYLITLATYNEQDKWNINDEKKLYKLLSKLTKKGVKWCLTNVIEKNGQKNNLLQNFIKKEGLKEIIINSSFKNYQRKKGKTKEIMVKNYEKNWK